MAEASCIPQTPPPLDTIFLYSTATHRAVKALTVYNIVIVIDALIDLFSPRHVLVQWMSDEYLRPGLSGFGLVHLICIDDESLEVHTVHPRE